MNTTKCTEVADWAGFVSLVREHAISLSPQHQERLEFELYEINKQGLNSVWIDYYNKSKKFESNPNNLLIPWVLGMLMNPQDPLADRKTELLTTTDYYEVKKYVDQHGAPPHDFKKDNDVPDIDIDCLTTFREDLKSYAARRFGGGEELEELQVCSVGTWQTYKFKQAIADAAAALGKLDRRSAQDITTNLPEDVNNLKPGGIATCKGTIKDETGKDVDCGHVHGSIRCPKCGSDVTDAPTLTRLVKEIPELREFARDYSEVLVVAARMVGRIRTQGVHAGAIVIVDRKLFGFVPMYKSKESGPWITMWSEGGIQILSKLGIIKWDLLGLKTMDYITNTCSRIAQNRGIRFGKQLPPPVPRYFVTLRDGTKRFIKATDTVMTPNGPLTLGEAVDQGLISVDH